MYGADVIWDKRCRCRADWSMVTPGLNQLRSRFDLCTSWIHPRLLETRLTLDPRSTRGRSKKSPKSKGACPPAPPATHHHLTRPSRALTLDILIKKGHVFLFSNYFVLRPISRTCLAWQRLQLGRRCARQNYTWQVARSIACDING